MADSTLDSELIVLVDNWPGVAQLVTADKVHAMGGFTSSKHHNVSVPQFTPGEKLCVWNDNAKAGQPGMSTMIYLKVGTQNAADALAAKAIVVPDSATQYWVVTDDPDDCITATGSTLGAYAISAMTDGNYGWFWCGGVCPEGWVAALGGNYITKDGTVAGALGTTDQTADEIGIGPIGADTSDIIGFALAADA